jgi:hypothetical protein
MSDEVMERVIACWSFDKITNISHLLRETTWAEEWVHTYGQSVVDILCALSPFDKPAPVESLPHATLIHPVTVLADPSSITSLANLPGRSHTVTPCSDSPQLPANVNLLLAPQHCAPQRRPRAPNRCRGCGQTGHNRVFMASFFFILLIVSSMFVHQSARVKPLKK